MKRLIVLAAGLVLAAAFVPRAARGQAPQIDLPAPPGVAEGGSKLGAPIGASGAVGFENAPEGGGRPIGGRPGPSASRAPVSDLTGPRAASRVTAVNYRPQVLEPARIPRYGELAPPLGPEDLGPENGLTLDQSIERLVRENLNLLALRFELPMAEADVLTASLRANPIFYADSQLVPYGHYSNHRPGGQRQFDVNVTYPIDVTHKRKARTEVAVRARRVVEAQFQDAIRLQIDNLYTAYVDVVAAGETVDYSRAYATGITRLLGLNERRLKEGLIHPATVDALRAQVEQAQLQVREAQETLVTTTRTLAVLLNVPRDQAGSIQLRAALRDIRPVTESDDAIIQRAVAARPDLIAFRLGLERSRSDINLARANRYPDVYVLYQPYTLQDNTPFGLKNAYSWALGVTATIPAYNRNQGNISRAQLNHRQTAIEMNALERQVIHEAEMATREFRLSLTSVLEFEREIVPASKRVRDTALRRFEEGLISALEYLEAQREFNDVVKQYRDGLVRHRRAMLDLNTAVGIRLLP
jgi:cobalt-zinc-cadmium efflux system outer membrane protein